MLALLALLVVLALLAGATVFVVVSQIVHRNGHTMAVPVPPPESPSTASAPPLLGPLTSTSALESSPAQAWGNASSASTSPTSRAAAPSREVIAGRRAGERMGWAIPGNNSK